MWPNKAVTSQEIRAHSCVTAGVQPVLVHQNQRKLFLKYLKFVDEHWKDAPILETVFVYTIGNVDLVVCCKMINCY